MSEHPNIFTPIPESRFEVLSKEKLIKYIAGQEQFYDLVIKENQRLRKELSEYADQKAQKERKIEIGEELVLLREELFGKSSERKAAMGTTSGDEASGVSELEHVNAVGLAGGAGDPTGGAIEKKRRILLPSERYPNLPLVERETELLEKPSCSCCGTQMVDSGMTEDVEYLERVPATFQIIREKKHKYSCKSCQGSIRTTPALPRIKPGSAYSDATIIDVAVSKFCDLIPIGRQVKMAERLGVTGLPAQSLIELTHYLADLLKPVYESLKVDTMAARVLYADETPHKMLEGSETSYWFMWGFSSKISAYFELHDTRSGDVASKVLIDSNCEYLMSDVYSGYKKAVREANETRKANGKNPIIKIYCNAHARRKFIEALVFKTEASYFIERYQRIYLLEAQVKGKPPDEVRENRLKMGSIFEEMKKEALRLMPGFSSKSALVKAINYFLKNYRELTLFTETVDAPIDNNHQESLLRNPVIGRKTWYGTHSERGAQTTAILFSIIESCKMNGVNPRTYIAAIVQLIHEKKTPPTPQLFKLNPA